MTQPSDSQDNAFSHSDDVLRSDPRLTHDDPLLDCLMIVCTLHNITTSRHALTSGLPLKIIL